MKELKDSKELVSLVGEYYVLYKLATLGVRAYKLNDRFDFDIMTTSNIKIEVKTAHLIHKTNNFIKADGSKSPKDGWLFANHSTLFQWDKGKATPRFSSRYRSCDFFAFVCCEDNSDKVVSVYILPVDQITTSKMIWIPLKNSGTYTAEYKDRWDLIVKESQDSITDLNNKSKEMIEARLNKPANTYSTAEVAEMFGIPASYVTVWCKDNLVNYIPWQRNKGKALYRITDKGIEDVKKKLKI